MTHHPKSKDGLIAELELLEDRARHFGLFVTMRAINRAKNAAGWELAGNVELAGMASRDERN